ncbi:DUF979 domain-containing protein [Sedimentibacter sp. zth1]|uniref:DUF979 domain-containing protein n=1 Tax=Sedimentibacter sp. zth1 TaxID=2816908 RepID=UPI001A934BF6|nr:DUF979 domain-containing protein [Sedimentibacter sp. zth1]QSX05237.1 DUF979 domain-containing protein [Sedimentibacter sp. zth1]
MFFMNGDVSLGSKLLEILYMLCGIVCIYAGVKNAKDKENPSRLGTAIFWIVLGVVMTFGRYIPDLVNGILVFIMVIPAVIGKVKPGKSDAATPEKQTADYKKIGMKIFIPALLIGIFALIFAFIEGISSLVGMGVGVIVGAIILKIYNPENKVKTFMDDSERFLSIIGPVCLLPCLLGVLGKIFTVAGVGDVISTLVGNIIPEGNLAVGIIVYAIGMMLFTMIMGNAFAAITVMTVGIGAPFVFALGADPVICGMLALTCGYCGTLLTPMAANFNIVPVAILEMNDKWGVIKKQVVPALCLIAFQIAYMLLFGM